VKWLIALVPLMVVAFAIPARGQQLALDKVDRYLQDCQARLRTATPGFAVVLVNHDQIVFAKGFGVEVANAERPFSADSVSPLGSLTKSFTALAIMQLVERGQLDLDAPVIKYLSWFRTADRKRSDRITVRMLLTHTSGLPSRDEWTTPECSVEEAMEQAIRAVRAHKTSHEPGEAFEYSNEGYTVAGLIIHRVTGLSYCDYLQTAILNPLQMERSSAEEQRLKQLGALTGHSPGIERALPGRLPYVAAAAPAGGTFASTARDCGRYLIALMNHGRAGATQILKESSIEQMMTSAVDFPCPITYDDGGDRGTWHYGLGWMIADIDGRSLVFHEGDTGLAGSIAVIDRARALAVCILRNSSDVDPHRFPTLATMANNVLHLAVGEPVSNFGVPRKPDPTVNDFRPSRELLEQCLGTYVSESGVGRINIALHPDGLSAESLSAYVRTEELVDFRDESLFVLRSVRGGRRGSFRKLPNGPVVGLQLGGQKFRKVSRPTPEGYQEIRGADSRCLLLPARWSIEWRGPNFASADPNDPRIRIRGGISRAGDRPLNGVADAFRQRGIAVENGPIMTSSIGGMIWHQQSGIVARGDDKWQQLIAYTRLDDRIFFVTLTTPYGTLTNEIERVLLPLVSALGNDHHFASAWRAVDLGPTPRHQED
jgi:CubicO group peptidase (beta-lactamase class C family)